MNKYTIPAYILPSEHFFGELRAVELRFNPYHSPINGRFCSKDMLDAGGGTNSSESIDKSQKSGIIKSSEDFSYISATGPNEFEKGFSYNNLVNHWYGNDNPKISSHKKEYEDRGYDMEGYGELALGLVQKPVGNGIIGHKTTDGFVVRYDTKTGDFVKGNPKKGIKTMFMASQEYYDGQKNRETRVK